MLHGLLAAPGTSHYELSVDILHVVHDYEGTAHWAVEELPRRSIRRRLRAAFECAMMPLASAAVLKAPAARNALYGLIDIYVASCAKAYVRQQLNWHGEFCTMDIPERFVSSMPKNVAGLSVVKVDFWSRGDVAWSWTDDEWREERRHERAGAVYRYTTGSLEHERTKELRVAWARRADGGPVEEFYLGPEENIADEYAWDRCGDLVSALPKTVRSCSSASC